MKEGSKETEQCGRETKSILNNHHGKVNNESRVRGLCCLRKERLKAVKRVRERLSSWSRGAAGDWYDAGVEVQNERDREIKGV